MLLVDVESVVELNDATFPDDYEKRLFHETG